MQKIMACDTDRYAGKPNKSRKVTNKFPKNDYLCAEK